MTRLQSGPSGGPNDGFARTAAPVGSTGGPMTGPPGAWARVRLAMSETADTAQDRRDDVMASRGAGHPLHPPMVHGRPGTDGVVLDRRRGARRRVRGGDGLRRLLDDGVQRDRGVRHGRDAGPDDVRHDPWRAEDEGGGVARMFADVQTPERGPTRATRATSSAAPSSAHRDGLRPVLRRPGARVLPVQGLAGPRCSTRAATSTSRRSTPAPTSAARRCSRSRSSASTSSTPTTRSAPASTRSTCATPTR